jgi:hypothetical protein
LIGLFNLIDVISIDEKEFLTVAAQPYGVFCLEDGLNRLEGIGDFLEAVSELEALVF